MWDMTYLNWITVKEIILNGISHKARKNDIEMENAGKITATSGARIFLLL